MSLSDLIAKSLMAVTILITLPVAGKGNERIEDHYALEYAEVSRWIKSMLNDGQAVHDQIFTT